MNCKLVFVASCFLLLGLTSGQLIGPFQVCEMKCQTEMKAFHEVDSHVDVTKVCHDYCQAHAFDHLGTDPTVTIGR